MRKLFVLVFLPQMKYFVPLICGVFSNTSCRLYLTGRNASEDCRRVLGWVEPGRSTLPWIKQECWMRTVENLCMKRRQGGQKCFRSRSADSRNIYECFLRMWAVALNEIKLVRCWRSQSSSRSRTSAKFIRALSVLWSCWCRQWPCCLSAAVQSTTEKQWVEIF